MTSTVAPPKPPAATKAAGAGIALVLVAQLMIVLDSAVVNVALPRIADDLEFTPAALTWVLNGYTLAFGGLLLLGGRLGDVFGQDEPTRQHLSPERADSASGLRARGCRR